MTAQPTAADARPRWQRWLIMVSSVVLLLVGVLRIVTAFTEGHTLPSCDSRRAKDTLSDVFKERDLSPTSYSEIRTLSSTDDAVSCQATLPIDGGTLDVAYDFAWENDKAQMHYTITRR